MTKIEEIAEALLNQFRERNGLPLESLDKATTAHREAWIAVATVAIQAIREPTPAMLEAGVFSLLETRNMTEADKAAFASAFQAAVDAALEERP